MSGECMLTSALQILPTLILLSLLFVLFCSHLSDPYVNDPESLTSGQPSSVPAAWPLTHSHSSHAQRSTFLTKPTSTGDLPYLTSYRQLTRIYFSLTSSFSLSSVRFMLFGDMPKHISRASSIQQKHYKCPRFSPPIHFIVFIIASRCCYCHECEIAEDRLCAMAEMCQPDFAILLIPQ